MARFTPIHLVAMIAICVIAGASAQVPTGTNNVCCAFILNSSNRWQLVCNRPAGIPGAMPFPAGTILSGVVAVPGQIAQCVGRFPYPNPAPYRLPSNGVQLFSTPNGAKCAGQFNNFYQGLGPDGGFVVQCTGARAATAAKGAMAAITSFADLDALDASNSTAVDAPASP